MPNQRASDLGLALDASVVINLLGGGRLREVIRAMLKPVLVVQQVVGEVRQDPRKRGADNPALLTPYLSDQTIVQVSIEEAESIMDTYIDLVSAEPNGLGDGEAATIAYAVIFGHAIALDERKATAICRERFPQLQVFSSIDLFREAEQRSSLPREQLIEAVFDALRFARMRVPSIHEEWIKGMLTTEQLAQCPSLRRMI